MCLLSAEMTYVFDRKEENGDRVYKHHHGDNTIFRNIEITFSEADYNRMQCPTHMLVKYTPCDHLGRPLEERIDREAREREEHEGIEVTARSYD